MSKVRVKATVDVLFRNVDRDRVDPAEIAKRLKTRLEAAAQQDGGEYTVEVEAKDG